MTHTPALIVAFTGAILTGLWAMSTEYSVYAGILALASFLIGYMVMYNPER